MILAVVAATVPGPQSMASAQVALHHRDVRGVLQVCGSNHFGVYADGPSVREDDLGGFKLGECTNWAPVLPGAYRVSFWAEAAYKHPPQPFTVRVHRHGSVYQATYNGEGVVSTWVTPHERTVIDLT